MMDKHFKLTEETRVNEAGVTLHRIVATRDSQHAKAGQTGGFVAGTYNVIDEAWVADEAEVWGAARLRDFALAFGRAQVFDHGCLIGQAQVGECAKVFGLANICDTAKVGGNALVHGLGTYVYGAARFRNGADIKNTDDYIVYQGFDELGTLTAYRTTYGGAMILFGWIAFTIDEFISRAEKCYSNNPVQLQAAHLMANLIRLRFKPNV